MTAAAPIASPPPAASPLPSSPPAEIQRVLAAHTERDMAQRAEEAAAHRAAAP